MVLGLGFGRRGTAFGSEGEGQATQNESGMSCDDGGRNSRKGGNCIGTKNYVCRNYQKRGTCRYVQEDLLT